MATGLFDRDSVKLIPLLAALYLLLKAYVVANYSLTTAGALVVAAPLTVLVGTVTSYLNLALLITAFGSATWLVRRRLKPDPGGPIDDSKVLDAMAFGLLISSVLFLPWPFSVGYFRDALLWSLVYVVTTGIGVVLLGLLVKRLTARPRLRWLRETLSPGHLAAVWVVLLLLPTLSRPWVPAEVLVLRHPIAIQDSHLQDGELQRSSYAVVYVLSEGSKWTTVLDTDTRILLRLPTSSVAHRQVCRYSGQPPGSVPIWAYLAGFRYDSPNTFCSTLVNEHATRLDPLVTEETSEE